ncbi:hypothetical protein EJ02DRAFT_460958 [Clathrospora elynae]|uniref:HTH psq-type domain-containing protein n=1 Tax=Clathrospora elynae TaxID=706981 RepID=A0A6A5S492_9PLEO|nr:hypothetical protein EJ02DRAFT_460958 [Clathrospora elynae]
MTPIEKALADLEFYRPEDDFLSTEIAAKHGVVRTTLMRRHKGLTHSLKVKAVVRVRPTRGYDRSWKARCMVRSRGNARLVLWDKRDQDRGMILRQ